MTNPSGTSEPATVLQARIRIILAGVERGPFSAQRVHRYLEDGVLLPTDPAKFDEREEWTTVNEVLEQMPPPTPVERLKRKKRKSSSAKLKALRKKQLRYGTCFTLVAVLCLAFVFRNNIFDLYMYVNFLLYQEWLTISF